jgi:peptidoglycan/xylan/chitin deacetylase (PgdA/CDA1 family)
VDWIGRRFQFVSLDDIGSHVASGEPFDRPVASITFDDGYRDVYENAFPILTRKGAPAAVFVVTEHLDRSCWLIHDRLYHLFAKAYEQWPDPWRGLSALLFDADIPLTVVQSMRAASTNPYTLVSLLLPEITQVQAGLVMDLLEAQVGRTRGNAPGSLTWSMVEAMHRAGFTIGSHTKTHPWLANESPEKTLDEIAGSKETLETRLGEPVRHLAYPGGQFTPPVVDQVAKAGYPFAYTACEHHDSRYPTLTIERLLLWEGSSIGSDGRFSSSILDCQAYGLWPPARRCERVHAA